MRLALALSLALLTACNADDGTGSGTSSTPAGDPTLAFVSPKEGESISGGSNGDVNVELAVENITLVARGQGTGNGTEGFILLTPDGDTSKQSEMNARTTSMSGLFAGPHKLTAELVTPDGEPFDPAIVAEVSFEVVP